MTKPTVFLDVDNTILDVDGYKRHIGEVIEANYGEGASDDFWQVYAQVKEELGYNVKEVATRFAKLRNSPDLASAVAAFLEVSFTEYLFPHARELLRMLSRDSQLIIFSTGDELLQKKKVEDLGLYKMATEVIISASKMDLLKELAKKYSPPYIVIDDRPSVIEEAKRSLSDAVTVWVKIGDYANRKQTVGADLETDDLKEVLAFLRKII